MPQLQLHKVEVRNRVAARREPYWQHLARGKYLGFRKLTASTSGTWIARCRDDVSGKQRYQPLGTFDHLPGSERHGAARAAAEAWFSHLGMGGTAETVTVRLACERYVAHLRQHKGQRPAHDTAARFERHVYSQPISRIELPKLTREHFRAWRARLVATPVTVGKGDAARDRERSASSINRDMTPLRAALNYALSEGWVTTDFSWASVLVPIENADKRRDVYLSIDERRRLVAACDGSLGLFLRGLSMLPLRPGALAALTVKNYDPRLRVLTVGKDKAGQDRKVALPPPLAALLDECAQGKTPAAPLFTRDGAKAWNKDAWKKPIKAATKAAGLDERTVAYAMRHSAITDLIKGQRVDLLTVAQLAGTSVAMIERHYGHLLREHATQALAALAI